MPVGYGIYEFHVSEGEIVKYLFLKPGSGADRLGTRDQQRPVFPPRELTASSRVSIELRVSWSRIFRGGSSQPHLALLCWDKQPCEGVCERGRGTFHPTSPGRVSSSGIVPTNASVAAPRGRPGFLPDLGPGLVSK